VDIPLFGSPGATPVTHGPYAFNIQERDLMSFLTHSRELGLSGPYLRTK
jgi:hypothetical protein